MVRPFANNDNTIVSTSPSRRTRFATITGSRVALRSLGTSTSTGPTLSVNTVLVYIPATVFLPESEGRCSGRRTQG